MKTTANIAAGLLALLMGVPAMAAPGIPPGWMTTTKPGEYEFGTEHVQGSEGRQSAYIKANPGATGDAFGSLMQRVKADAYIGQRLRVSARLKSEGAAGLQLWFRVDGPDSNKPLAFYNMDDQPVTGTTDWKRYDVVLDVPPGSTFFYYGFFLRGGKGEGWADAFRVEKVDNSVPVSAAPNTSVVNSTPANLNFDQ